MKLLGATNWNATVWVALIAVGVYTILTAPPAFTYELDFDGVDEDVIDSVSVVAFQDLSDENAGLFLETINGGNEYADRPKFPAEYVSYEGKTYHVETDNVWNRTDRRDEQILGLLTVFVGAVPTVFGIRRYFLTTHSSSA